MDKLAVFSPSAHCMSCGNEGFEDKVCESCGREPKRINLHALAEKSVEKFISMSKFRKIPEEYIGNEWSSTIFWRTHENIRNRYLESYVQNLEFLHDKFASGHLPQQSAIICSPRTFSKATWAFSCMQLAMHHNYSVAPFLDTMEVQRLITVSAENPSYKLYKHIEHDEYFMNDVMFISVTSTEYSMYAYSVISEVLNRRSRKGLSTFILSETPIDVIASHDKSGNFKKLLSERPGDNWKKIAVVVSYKE